MSKHHLRHDRTCLNCGYAIDKRFCSSCGQENVESRQSFGHLVRHFAEDFTHYEGSFWRTIKYLLFRPAYLTKAYLAGKRASYVVPVKLYIFISFIAFFIPHLLPDYEKEEQVKQAEAIHGAPLEKNIRYVNGYSNLSTYDSAQQALPPTHRDNILKSTITRRSLALKTGEHDKLTEKIQESMVHNLPKVFFFYMPIFALVIWLFHNKKKWYYSDHVIFTLHYFSFVLLLITICNVITGIVPWVRWLGENLVEPLLYGVSILWIIYYFFRGHHKLYEESRIVSWIKSGTILLLNSLIFLVILIAYVVLIMTITH